MLSFNVLCCYLIFRLNCLPILRPNREMKSTEQLLCFKVKNLSPLFFQEKFFFMQMIKELVNEIRQKESNGLLAENDLRLLLLKAMNYVMLKYGNYQDDTIMKHIDELQQEYNHLAGAGTITKEDLAVIKDRISQTLLKISGQISGKNYVQLQ